ncbi:MAG: autotransporter domain-containing protein [Verrucomicrobiota bacterium]
MKLKLLVFIYLLGVSVSLSATFVVGDSATGVTNVTISPTLAAGDTINFTGTINSPAGDVVAINPVLSGLTINVQSGASLIATGTSRGLSFSANFDGTLNIFGSISTTGGTGDAVNINGSLTGTLNNAGTLTGGDDGLSFTNLDGTLINSGTITGNGGLGLNFSFISNGSRLINTGTITGGGNDGIDFTEISLGGSFDNSGTITGALNGLCFVDIKGSFINSGTITGTTIDGMDFVDMEAGSIFNNSGTISGRNRGVDFVDMELGSTFINSGTISGSTSDGVNFIDLETGAAMTNSGTISGLDDGIDMTELEVGATLTNSGIIQGGNHGLETNATNGTFINGGGRVQGGTGNSILLGTGNGTVILSGPSHIVGVMDGGAGAGDILRFQDIRGISDAKKAELIALAASDADGSIELFGETISWINFEDIQVDLSSIQSYQNLITAPGLADFGKALDNVLGLNDNSREYLVFLSNLDVSLLNDVATNLSGQTLLNGLNDFVGNQDTTFFNSLMQQFNSFRTGGAGFSGNSFSLLRDFDSYMLQNLNNNLIALDAQGVSDVATLDRQSIEPLSPHTQDWSFFVSGYGGAEFQDSTSQRTRRSATNATVLLGGGSWLTENLYAGAFTGYTRHDADVDRFGSHFTDHAAYFGINLQYTQNHWFASVAAAYGYHSFNTNRWDISNNEHKADSDGHQGLVFGQIGYDWYVGEDESWRITPFAGVAYSHLSFDRFSETGGTSLTNLRIDGDTVQSLQSTVGFETAKHVKTFFGWIRPYFGAAWWHSFLEQQTYRVSLVTPGFLSGFNVESTNANEDRASMSTGVSFALDELDHWVMTVGYQGTVGSEGYHAHTGTAGIRYGF